MRPPGRSWIVESLFSLALLAYPRAFRRRFGDEMRDDFRRRTLGTGTLGTVGTNPLGTLGTLGTFGTLILEGLSERRSAVARWAFFPNHIPHLYEPAGRHAMFWDTLRSDIRHTLRMAVKTPLFTALTILALALGIGATSAIFAVVNGVLLRSLPYQNAERLVNVWSDATLEKRSRNPISPANYVDFERMNKTLDAIASYYTFVTPRKVASDTGAEVAVSVVVTPNLFNVLGRSATLGRALNPQDTPGVAVISDGYWRRRFGADPAIVGKTINSVPNPVQIVGVMPSDFVFPYPGMLGPSGFTRITQVDMWTPMTFSGPQAQEHRMLTQSQQLTRNVHWLGAIGRLKPGVNVQAAEADFKTMAAQLEQTYPDTNKGWSASVVPTMDQAVGGVRSALMILLAGIGCVLLMAAVNVANLLLARSIAREKELATRAALGAGRARLARQLLTESLLFALAGGLLGILVMQWGVQGLVALAPGDLPRMNEISVDWRVLSITAVTTMLTGVLVGLLPALSTAGISPQATLQDHSRGTVGGSVRRRARAALVVAEVALAVALTTGAGLLIRSFVSVLNVNPGFETEHLLTWQMNIPDRLRTPEERLAFYRDFFARIESLPGIVDVGGTTRIPLGSTSVTTTVQIDGKSLPQAELPEVQFRRAMHNYFRAMGMPIVKGRGFNLDDGPTVPMVVVINQTMARRLFPNEDPIGQRVRMGQNANGPWNTIVGVVGDIRHGGLEEQPQPEMYITYLQGPPVSPFIVIRTSGDPASLAETVKAEARNIDKDLPLIDMRTMTTLRSETLAQRRFILVLVAAFGVLALGLAAIGVYGVMSLVVSERTHEVGVRLALGANPLEVLRMILRQALTLAGSGAIIGAITAAALTPLMASQLFGIAPIDPTTFALVPMLLLLIGAVAAIVPARRAMRVDPLTALRYE